MEEEVWRSVVGFEGLYEVSDQGRVRSLNRIAAAGRGGPRTYKGKVLAGFVTDNGYRGFHLYKNTRATSVLAHRLVATAFVSAARVDQIEVNHKNHDRLDNRTQNLEWCTRQENMDHASAGGRVVAATDPTTNPLVWKKLSLEIAIVAVKDIQNRVRTKAQVAADLGVGRSTVTRLWKSRERYLTADII